MKKYYLLIGLLTALQSAVLGQLNITYFTGYHKLDDCLSLKTRGMLTSKYEDKKTFVFTHYDTNMNVKKTWRIPKPIGYETSLLNTLFTTVGYNEYTGEVYILMNINASNFEVHILNLMTGIETTVNWKLPKESTTSAMCFSKNQIWLMALSGGKYTLYHCTPQKMELIEMPLAIGDEKLTLKSLELLDNDEIAIGYSYGKRKATYMGIAIISGDGALINKDILTNLALEDRRILLTASIKHLQKEEYIISGMIYLGKARHWWTPKYYQYVDLRGNGMYFMRIIDTKIVFLTKLEYKELNNYHAYLNDKEKKARQEAIRERVAKGKKFVDEDFALMHRVIDTKDGLIFIGETIDFNMEPYITHDMHNELVTAYRFNSYSCRNAFAVCLDRYGKKISDYNLPLGNQTRFVNLMFNLQVSADDEKLTIVQLANQGYSYTNIVYKEITSEADDELSPVNIDVDLDKGAFFGDGIWGYNESEKSLKFIRYVHDTETKKLMRYQYITAKIK